LLFLALLAIAPGKALADGRTGEQTYRQQCASCHGAEGEGVPDEFPKPLAGDRSIPQLSALIARTMPSDDPGTCTGEDADRVATYIHDTFYSRAARERNQPPRVELARLTVPQYRNAVADLIGSFRGRTERDDRLGLQGEYFNARDFRDNLRVIDRLDPEVRFDFGKESPEPGKIEPREFVIRWKGSVLAPETGDYEFIVRTDHATRLWVNHPKKPLIDAWVKSGDGTEYRGSIRLLGGRRYPIRLEFAKASQGVKLKKEERDKLPIVPASIALEWKPERRAAEVIPARSLSPISGPEVFVSGADFPPDDRSVGYERGTSVSKAWDQATTDGAIEVATYVVDQLRELSGAKPDGEDRVKTLREFCVKFVERAFRRPLDDETKARYVDHQFERAASPEAALKRVVLLALKSPRFLYREVGGETPDGHDVAARIAFGLWDSLPDEELTRAGFEGKLANDEQVARQAERMMADPRAVAKLRAFFLQWLKVEAIPDVAKDPSRYPGFDQAIVSDLRTSLELFLEDAAWGQRSDLRQVLTAEGVYLNGRLAKFYGIELPEDAPFRKVELDPGERAGVLSHPYLMATFAYTGTTSPIHRGVFLARSVLGRSLQPPPEAFSPLAPDLHPSLNTRERVALQTQAQACMSCHSMINPLGFALERFDAVGRYRGEEAGRPVDASGSYEDRSGGTAQFAGARDLATFLAGSDETHAAFVEQLFHHLVKQPIRAYGPRVLADLCRGFAEDEYDVRKLAIRIIAASAPIPTPAPPRTP